MMSESIDEDPVIKAARRLGAKIYLTVSSKNPVYIIQGEPWQDKYSIMAIFGHYDLGLVQRDWRFGYTPFGFGDMAMTAAFKKASYARFEHGETP